MNRLWVILLVSVCSCDVAPPLWEGTEAPKFDLETIAGTRLASDQLQDDIVILDFWATWCVPCIQEAPVLNELTRTFGDRVKVVSICIQSGFLENILPRASAMGLQFPVLIGDRATADAFGIRGLPTTFVIDRRWKVYRRYLGAGHKRELEDDIHKLTDESYALNRS